MSAFPLRTIVAIVLVFAFALVVAASALAAGGVSPELRAMVRAAPANQQIPVIIRLSDRVDANQYGNQGRGSRDGKLVKALKGKAAKTQGPLKKLLKDLGVDKHGELWLINGVAVTVPASLVDVIAKFPGVESVRPDTLAVAPAVTAASTAPPEWNLDVVRAPDLWSLGFTGAGVVVANMDTGVDAAHPDLAGRWRGGANSWYDPHAQHATPYDASGHGTQTMGLIVGGGTGGTSIGVAPDARWIAVKIYNDAGQANYSHIHLGFQWLLDPDNNPDTQDAPDVVNASWGLVGSAGQCITEFDADIQLLKTAGIAIAISAGNDGPAATTSLSPANNPSSFAVGALDASLIVASFSARGPSACGGGGFPHLVAPGVNVNTTDLSFGGFPFYVTVTGTSYAAPHAAGTMALLINAFPTVTVGALESALTQGATDLGAAGGDNAYGSGLLNANAAYQLLGGAGSPPSITSTPVTTATQGTLYTYAVNATDSTGSALTFALTTAPAGMTIDAATGMIRWTPTNAQVGANAVTVRVTNASARSATQSFSIDVANLNDAPLASNNAYSTFIGATLTVAAPGVLGNDSDPDRDPITAELVAGPAHGTLALAPNGSFTYTPAAGYSGTDMFTYRASDGTLYSNLATVTITITNRPPTSAADAYTTPQGETLTVAAPGVLANDSDPDAEALTAALVSGPAKGTLTLNANGSFTYVPNAGASGTDTFTYRPYDGALYGPTATVTITVTANRPPVAANDSKSAPWRWSSTYTPVVINVLVNDTDPDGNLNPASVTIASAPTRGGTVTVNANGSVSYSPKLGYRGADTFRYRVRDTLGLQSNVAIVTVMVQ
jgi:subtilisin family serine protease